MCVALLDDSSDKHIVGHWTQDMKTHLHKTANCLKDKDTPPRRRKGKEHFNMPVFVMTLLNIVTGGAFPEDVHETERMKK